MAQEAELLDVEGGRGEGGARELEPWPVTYDDGSKVTWVYSKVKGSAWLGFVAAGFLALASLTEPPGPLPEPSLWRAGCQSALLVTMLLELLADVAIPGNPRSDEHYELIRMVGHTAYMTTSILYTQTTVAAASCWAEWALVAGVPHPRLMALSYAATLFAATEGIVLAVLYLQTTYCDEKWQETVLRPWLRTGYPYALAALGSHVLSLPVGLLDVLVARDRHFLHLCKPPWYMNLAFLFAFSATYFCWLHFQWWLTGCKTWPYPYMKELDTFPKRMALTLAYLCFAMVVMLPMIIFV